MKKPLCVVTSHFNPQGYQLPRRNLERFCEQLGSREVDLFVAEAVFEDQETFWAQSGIDHEWLSVDASRERCCIWQKEALLNVLIRGLVSDYDAIAWVDADVLFMSDTWLSDTMRELDMSPVCQMFSQANQLDKESEVFYTVKSVGWHLSTQNPLWRDFRVAHPGYAWAARSEVLRKHGLYAHMVTGCGDTAMLHGFMNKTANGFEGDIGAPAMAHLRKWADGVYDDVHGQVGFVLGAVMHLYHGEKADRQNRERRYVMREIDPEQDLFVNRQGLLEWTDHAVAKKPRLVKAVADYFASRKEDGPVLQPNP